MMNARRSGNPVRGILRLLAILTIMPGSMKAATWYVTQSGAGAANGTSGNSWAVNQFNGNSNLAAGDTVILQGRITSQITAPRSGASGKPITISGLCWR
jgi:uncharacterized protein YdeI (BOF family)